MDRNMISKEETGIKSSNVDRVEETLIEGTKLTGEANMSRAKVKMEQVREENARLKRTLSQMMENYHSLKMQFSDLTHQSNISTNLASMAAFDDESDFVSLSLGRFSADSKSEEIKKKNNSFNETKNQNGIELGLKWKLQSDSSGEVSRIPRPENGFDESIEEGSESRRSPKNSRDIGDDEILQNPMKKTRVSVRTVCSTQTMHDGCQWRKYGQKISKGNPCPRAYYRCTVASSCPVRKQVQRCIDDMSILVTTYEGTHNHPLPPSAATMASATSAAPTMLSCGSSTSPPRLGVSATSSTSPSLFGFNFPSNNFPRATISTSQSHPTVVLDLTAPNHTTRFSSTPISAKHSAPTSLNFSSFNPQIGWETKFPTRNDVAPSSYSLPPLLSDIHKQAVDDRKIAAATKAITHDPNFQSALAAAITSFVGNSNSVGRNSSGMNFGLNFSQPSMRKT